jgi:hypothetical protein
VIEGLIKYNAHGAGISDALNTALKCIDIVIGLPEREEIHNMICSAIGGDPICDFEGLTMDIIERIKR